MNKIEEFRKRRESGNQKVLGIGSLSLKRFYALDTQAYQDGAISAVNKELMGLACSAVLRCNDCIMYHLDQCHSLGVSKEEVIEALNVATVVGGSIVIPHLRLAFEVIDELWGNETPA